MNVTIELYKKDEMFCAYISDNCGGSGYKIIASTYEERAERIKDYFLDNKEWIED